MANINTNMEMADINMEMAVEENQWRKMLGENRCIVK
jgi:hypothetical protein